MSEKKTKPGWQTTEFWMNGLLAACGLVLASGAITSEPILQGIGFVCSALMAMGYTGSRTVTKKIGKPDA